MDSKYLITKSGGFVSEDDLYHWGIKGMKWGVRRYQNPDCSLTSAGRNRYMNPDGTLNEKGKKKFGNKESGGESSGSSKTSSSTPSAAKIASDMSDSDLQARVNRLRNEDAYRDLSKKLGYDEPKTELDIQIAQMEKQKKYLELQRDIKNLTPKKISKGKKLMETLMNKVIEPAATSAGKKLLEQYLTDKGMEKLKKKADEVKDKVDKSKERVEKKEEKKARKEAEKQRGRYDQDDPNRYSVEGEGASSRPKTNNTGRPKSSSVIDTTAGPIRYTDLPVPIVTTTRNVSSGSSYVSQYRNTPVSALPSPNISGYLPAPKDDD